MEEIDGECFVLLVSAFLVEGAIGNGRERNTPTPALPHSMAICFPLCYVCELPYLRERPVIWKTQHPKSSRWWTTSTSVTRMYRTPQGLTEWFRDTGRSFFHKSLELVASLERVSFFLLPLTTMHMRVGRKGGGAENLSLLSPLAVLVVGCSHSLPFVAIAAAHTSLHTSFAVVARLHGLT